MTGRAAAGFLVLWALAATPGCNRGDTTRSGAGRSPELAQAPSAGTPRAANATDTTISSSPPESALARAWFESGRVPDPASAPDSVGALGERLFLPPGGGPPMGYLFYAPPGVERRDRWPLILYLHGRSQSGNNLALLKSYGLPRILNEGRALPFFVVAPQVPVGERWTDMAQLDALLDEMLERYPVDPGRVYLTGFSMGGGGVWRMATAHPERFAAAAPLAALTPPYDAATGAALRRLPIWAFHGTADTVTPPTTAQSMIAALQVAGVNARLTLIPGASHDISRVYHGADLYAWFLEHRRAR